MQVRVFEGFNMKDVMKNIKEAFGKDAVILSSREKNVDGTNTKMIEVKVAAADTSRVAGAQALSGGERWLTSEDVAPFFSQIERRFQMFEDQVATKDQILRMESGIKDMSALLNYFLQEKIDPNIKKLPVFVQDLYHQLAVTGITKSTLIKLLKHLRSLPTYDDNIARDFSTVEEYYKALAIRYFLPQIKIAPAFRIQEGSTAIHCFVGAEGSGKTTAIAKLCSMLKKSLNANILLANYDQKSAIPSDGLRVYSKIVNVPYLNIQTYKELESHLIKHPQFNVVLIDSFGSVPRSQSAFLEYKNLAHGGLPVDIHLVLSLTERLEQMESALRAYAPLGLNSMLFTKLDESIRFGDIYNLSEKWSIPLSFFSTGQKIPDDFERASRERVIERIMGL